ncbi:MAG: aldo/keto reductase [Bacteroidetes bacterium]|nr:aldo/keto reductase [Bacteroidota bacterium]
MEKRLIPGTNESLPLVGLGTWQTFGTPHKLQIKNADEVLNRFLQEGGSVVDSSPMYGNAESVIGESATRLKIRDRLFLATKVWTSGKEKGISQINDSFRKMKTKRIDLMQVHNLVDVHTHLATLRKWKEEGRIRYIGITHYTSSAYPALMKLLRNEKLDFVQFNYNILRREAEKELLPLSLDKGVAVLINRPFEEGALFQRIANKQIPAWVSMYGIRTWSQYFLKFIISHPAVTCVIPASADLKHLAENMAAGSNKIPDENMRKEMVDYFNSL